MGVVTNVIIAVFASIIAVVIFQGLQYAFFSQVIKDVTSGNYTHREITIGIMNVTSDYVKIYIPRDDQTRDLKERESVYSGCYRITLVDIRGSSADIDIVDDIICEIQRSAYDFGRYVIEYGTRGKEKIENVTSQWIK